MSTSLDRKYNRTVQEAMAQYKIALETNSTGTRLKAARNAIEKFEKSYEYAQYIDLPKHKNEIQEYLAVSSDLLGQSHFENSNFGDAKQAFLQALKYNQSTTKSKKKQLREIVFHRDLLETHFNLEESIEVERIALKLFKLNKKCPDIEEQVKYYRDLPKYFIQLSNYDHTEKIYKKLLKIVNKRKYRDKFQKTKAEIMENYGKFLITYTQRKNQGKIFLEQALDHYQNLALFDKYKSLQTTLDALE